MKSIQEVERAFSSVKKLTDEQEILIEVVQNSFSNLATQLVVSVPLSPDRTVALRKLLESKMMAIQAITHHKDPERACAGYTGPQNNLPIWGRA